MKKILILVQLFILIFLIGLNIGYSQSPSSHQNHIFELHHHWVDSMLNTLSPEEQIAQLIFIDAYSNKDIAHEVAIADLVRKYHIGGLIFFKGTPDQQARLTNYYQSVSKVPLLIAMDGEWGLGFRLKNTINFPFQMTLGAIQDNSLIYEMGREIGREFKRLGVHVNFAPVVDINNNPSNPVINYRSFGMDKEKVASKAISYMKGLQDEGIMATAKHFPGHGDTDTDSHHTLPVIKHNSERLKSVELYPFQKIIEAGVGGIMTAHLNVPALDSASNSVASLSRPIVTNLLKNELGFQGLVFTDALNMKSVSDLYPPGNLEVKALLAGNDILEFTRSVPKAIAGIKKAADEGEISWSEIKEKCRKVLAAKYWAGLDQLKPVELENIYKDLNTPEARILNQKLIRSALTILRNTNDVLPVKNLANTRIASIALGSTKPTTFQNVLGKYTKIDHYYLDSDKQNSQVVLDKLKSYDLVITGIFGLDQRPYKNFGVTDSLKSALQKLVAQNKTIVAVFGNPYSLDRLTGIENADGLILAYQNNRVTHDQAAQLIFGANSSTGTLPVKINESFKLGDGIVTSPISRLKYTIPEEEGLSSAILKKKIDSIAIRSIEVGAFPGCEVLVARNGAVVFHKTYGYHTYENRNPVSKDDLFDFASVTKVTGPLPALMQLHDEGKFKLDEKFSTYWPDFKRSGKSELTVREILAHQSGLKSWIPYWKNTVKENGNFKYHTFKKDSSDRYNVPVDVNMYLYKNYIKKIYKAIKKSPVSEEKKYLYSGLSFYLYPQIIENLSGTDFETYVRKNIYEPIGAYTLGYNPYLRFPIQQIVPTENDTFFRHTQIHGYVHDEGAAMMGGVSGNAGLFGTANDLAKLMQMYLQMGTFGGEEIISKSTMEEFTHCQYPDNENRRGLGFDKPLLNNDELSESEAYPAKSASPSSFGHSGFTGTFVWVDPAKNIVYVFFSNRVYQTRENNKISRLNIRSSILEAIYTAIK